MSRQDKKGLSMTTADGASHFATQPRVYQVGADELYNAMGDVLEFNANFDVIRQDAQNRTMSFATPSVTGLFTARVVQAEDGTGSQVQVIAPVHAGEDGTIAVQRFENALDEQVNARTHMIHQDMSGKATQMMDTAGTSSTVHHDSTSRDDAKQTIEGTATIPLAIVPKSTEEDSKGNHARKGGFKEHLTDRNPGKLSKAARNALVLSVLSLVFSFFALARHFALWWGLAFFVITAAFCVRAFLKTAKGKEHGRMVTVVAACCSVVALLLSCIGAAIGGFYSAKAISTKKDCHEMSWPQGGLIDSFPSMQVKRGYVSTDSADYLRMEVCDATKETFTSYSDTLKSKGFTKDYGATEISYHGMNSDNYYVYSYLDAKEHMISLTFKSPAKVKEEEEQAARWKAEQEKKAEEKTKQSDDADKDAAKKAAEEADAKQAEEKAKQAEEEARQKEAEAKKAEEAQQDNADQQQAAGNGVSSGVKEALDSYESYMNRYCDFMEKYNKNDRPLSMLTEYTSMLDEYSKMTQKIDGLDQATWSHADLQYYLEVMNRVNQRLASIS